ncbi:hypothetical protein C0992_013161 [Termitomyces sp. T32_za158]|nr:hypothetical protein C0992_013161 [Termitomyces sp. T32_za158]
MGQYFDLCNLDNTVNVDSSVSGKFGEFYFSSMNAGTKLLRALWNPNEDEKRVVVLPLNKAKNFSILQESDENLSKGLLNKLSNEVLHIIFGNILDILDLINLMVTCQRYWELGRHYLERLIEDFIVVSWAGDRLICLGDYARLDDLPRGMLTDPEVEDIRPLYNESHSLQDTIITLQKPRYKFSSATARRMLSISSTLDFLYQLDSIFLERTMAGGESRDGVPRVLKKLVIIKNLDPVDFFNGHMVFRNLTTKKYVRGDGIKKARNMPGKRWLKRMSFEHVLYIRTTWSSDPSLSCGYRGPLRIHRGVWAGHRFDVTHIGRVVDEDGVAVDNWKDVTEEVINEVIVVLDPEA